MLNRKKTTPAVQNLNPAVHHPNEMVHMHILTIFCNKIPRRYLPLGSTFRPKQISRQVRVFAEVHPPAAMQAKWVKRRYTSHSLGVLGCKE